MRTLNDFNENYNIHSEEKMEPYNFFPGLSRSNEVYFGRESPLPLIIKKHVASIKADLMIENANGKKLDKSTIDKLWKKCQLMSNDIKQELNCEYLEIHLDPTNKINADAYTMINGSEFLVKSKQPDGTVKEYLSFSKIKELEDIAITKTGYRYVDPKGKFLGIRLTVGLFRERDVDRIVGTLLHELGHCFQIGVMGTYKQVADMYFASLIDEQMKRYEPLKPGTFSGGISLFFAVLFSPLKIISNISSALRLRLFKNVFKKINSSPTKRMEDMIEEKNNNENGADLTDDEGCITVFKILSNDLGRFEGSGFRKEYIEKNSDEDKAKLENLKLEGLSSEQKEYKDSQSFFKRMIYSINANMVAMATNLAYTISLTDYNMKNIRNATFLQRWEYFADIFASSYGYGAETYIDNLKPEVEYIEDWQKYENVGFNKLGIFRLMNIYSRYKNIRRISINDRHGAAAERNASLYNAMLYELENNKTLTTKQREELKKTFEMIEHADQTIIKDQKENKGFWRKYYLELVNARAENKKMGKTEKEILEPVQRIALQCLKEK